MSKAENNMKSNDHFYHDAGHFEPVDQSCLTFLWNPKTKEFLGRTSLSWLKIIIFYIIYYICLGIFFFTCYKIFESISLHPRKPRWELDEGLIGTNPGVGFRPIPDQDKVESTLIWINRKNEFSESSWADQLDEFVNNYRNPSEQLGRKCKYGSPHADQQQFCIVDVEKLEGCVPDVNDKYGYTQNISKPCVLIKLNKIYGWTPEPYKTMEHLEIAKERNMPEELVERIEILINSGQTIRERLDTIWFSCEGENPGDRESIGKLQFFAPGFGKENFPGIPSYYFPYLNQEDYQAPFVFVRFENPRPYVLIQVECKAWALNIEADRYARQGSVHFEIMID